MCWQGGISEIVKGQSEDASVISRKCFGIWLFTIRAIASTSIAVNDTVLSLGQFSW